MPQVLYEGARFGAAIMSEGNFHISREDVLVAESQTILVNGLGAKVANPTGVVANVSFVGTGNGVMTLASPAYNTKVKDGQYKVTAIAAAANGGTFRVEAPDGTEIGNIAVGAAFNKEIKFTIADGAVDFAVGDEFTINVAADNDDFSYVAFNPAGTDGSEVPVAYFPYGAVTAAGETKRATALTNDCELNGNCIAWPVGITDPQRKDAIEALGGATIKLRY